MEDQRHQWEQGLVAVREGHELRQMRRLEKEVFNDTAFPTEKADH